MVFVVCVYQQLALGCPFLWVCLCGWLCKYELFWLWWFFLVGCTMIVFFAGFYWLLGFGSVIFLMLLG